jgi:hypothetical protein
MSLSRSTGREASPALPITDGDADREILLRHNGAGRNLQSEAQRLGWLAQSPWLRNFEGSKHHHRRRSAIPQVPAHEACDLFCKPDQRCFDRVLPPEGPSSIGKRHFGNRE